MLIAGGKNKGLDLSPLVELIPRLKSVIAIGDAAGEVEEVFSEHVTFPVLRAYSMTDAVMKAREQASAGDAVLLSPGCTSFDWYSSYVERGDDFRTIVQAMTSRDVNK